MALILYRVMRQRLKLAGSELSPEAALAELRRSIIQAGAPSWPKALTPHDRRSEADLDQGPTN